NYTSEPGNVEPAMKTKQLLAAAVHVAISPAAFADRKSEAYVKTNANAVLQVLNDKSLSAAQRNQKFSDYMHTFAHMPSIARRVLGAEGRSLSQAEFDRYYQSFENYAIAVYEVHL